MTGFENYNKKELIDRIEKISIERIGDSIVTSYYGRVVNTTIVSKRYEIFDIVKYLKDKIEAIEKNFTISKYKLIITKGVQSLQLLSDSVTINGVNFRKSFYIVNSTDKSRRLSFNAGLHSEKFYIIGINNISLTKKHLLGVTKAAEDASEGLNGETFDEQIKSLQSLIGHRIQFSKLREVILGDKEKTPQINHRKFDAMKNSIRHSNLNLTKNQIDMLFTPSESLKTISNDFYLDAFSTFVEYMKIFSRQDSHIIKKETDRIMKITQWSVRNSVLESLGI